jgi:uncharacterized protein (TIGR03437 family)
VVVFASDEVLRIQPEGAKASAPDALDPLPGKSNYLNREPAITGVPQYGRIRYRSVYPGIDLVYYGSRNELEYDFAVAPGARPERIRLTLHGANELRIDAAGDLVARLRSATFIQRKPQAWQSGADGVHRRIEVHYVLTSKKEVAFAIGAYDRSRPLIIDPLIDYATYLGAAGSFVESQAVVIAANGGNAYVTGGALPGQFPVTTGTVPSFTSGEPGFVAKLSADGTQLIYSTFLNLPAGQAIAVDSQGSAYVAGSATTADSDVGYIVKLTPDGSALAYSYDFGAAPFLCCSLVSHLVLDSAQNVYVLGSTFNYKFPTTSGSYQSTFPGLSSTYGFLIKLNAAGNVAYSTYLRVPAPTFQFLAVDGNQDAIVLTNAYSASTPPAPQSLQSSLLKLNPSGSAALSTMTFLESVGAAASTSENAASPIVAILGIGTDPAGTLYVTGVGSLSSNSAGIFVAELNSSGSLATGHYIPYSGNIYVDGSGNTYVVGAVPGEGTTPSGVFVTRVDSSFSTVTTSLLPGTNLPPTSQGATVDSAGNVYLIQSPLFPATPGAYQTTGGAFAVVKVDAAALAAGPAPVVPVITTGPVIVGIQNAANYLPGPIAPGEMLIVYGLNLGPAQLVSASLGTDGAANGQLPLSLAGSSLLIGGMPARMLYTSATQIAGIAPVSGVVPGTFDAGGRLMEVQVGYQGMYSPLTPPSVLAVSFPGLFTSDASGRGQGAILNQDGSVNSASNPAAAGTVVSLFCSGCGATIPPGIDGAIATSLAPLANPIVVTIGGQTAQVLYAGSAPGLLNGAVQINVTVPAAVSGNAVPVTVSVGGSLR